MRPTPVFFSTEAQISRPANHAESPTSDAITSNHAAGASNAGRSTSGKQNVVSWILFLRRISVYREIGDRAMNLEGAKSIKDSPRKAAGLEHRLKILERSLHSLQRQLQTPVPPENPNTPQVHSGATKSAAFTSMTVSSSVQLQEQDHSPIAFRSLDLKDQTLVATVSNLDVLQEFLSTHDELKGILESIPLKPVFPHSGPEVLALTAVEQRSRQSKLELAECALTQLPSEPVCRELLRVYFDVFYQIRPVVPWSWAEGALKELFKIPGLAEPRTVEGNFNAVAYLDLYSEGDLPGAPSAPLVNWNVVGVLSSMFGIAAYTAPQSLDMGIMQTHLPDSPSDGIRSFALKMHSLVGICWQICDPHRVADESLVLLLYFYFMMHVVFGQYIPFLEHLYGSLISATSVLGLQRETTTKDCSPEDTQRRRSVFAAVYHLDKIHATFHGRAPLILRRFGNTPLPAPTTEAESYLRGQFLVAIAREEVMELIITSSRNPSSTKVTKLQKVIRSWYDSIPPEQRYDRKNPLITSDPCLNTHRILLYLFSLENSFLLQSAVRKRSDAVPDGQLLKTAMAMFSTMVRVWETRAQLADLAFTLSWLLTTYASASSGIIFSSILNHQAKSPSVPTDTVPPPLISISYHLRELQVFLDALSSILPDDPHYQTCKKAFRMFSKVQTVLLGTTRASSSRPQLSSWSSMESDGMVSPMSKESVHDSLQSNLMEFEGLPWLDYDWTNLEDQLMSEDTPQVGLE